jgi:hypothetical protein
MRSEVFERIINKMKKDPWYVKLRRWVILEIHIIKCLGIKKYIKYKL